MKGGPVYEGYVLALQLGGLWYGTSDLCVLACPQQEYSMLCIIWRWMIALTDRHTDETATSKTLRNIVLLCSTLETKGHKSKVSCRETWDSNQKKKWWHRLTLALFLSFCTFTPWDPLSIVFGELELPLICKDLTLA